jgi:hypothetical protein
MRWRNASEAWGGAKAGGKGCSISRYAGGTTHTSAGHQEHTLSESPNLVVCTETSRPTIR